MIAGHGQPLWSLLTVDASHLRYDLLSAAAQAFPEGGWSDNVQ
jgi:hypothetical protein